jgi:hypothetical protein
LNVWADYAEAMKVWSEHPGHGFIPPPQTMDFVYPEVIEGVTNLTLMHAMEMENGSVGAILFYYGIDMPAHAPYLFTAVIILLVVLTRWRQLRNATPADLLLFGFALHTILMIALPVLRFHYQFVMWVAPLLYILYAYREPPAYWYAGMMLAAFLVMGAMDLLPVNVLLAELILLGLVGAYLFNRWRPEPQVIRTAAAEPVPSAH